MKIVISGNYGAKNLGDEMILEGLLKSLKKIAPKAKITVLSGNPEETRKKHKVHSVNKFPAGLRSFFRFFLNAETIKAVKECDYFILGGGGLFGSLTFHANLIWGIQALWAYGFKKKLIMYGQSIGPIANRLDRYLVRRVFRGAKLICVRDSQSRLRLRKMKVRNKIHLMPDLALKNTTVKCNKRKNYVVISLRQINSLSLKFKKEIASYINLLHEEGFGIKIVNFQGGEYEDEYLTGEIIELVLRNVEIEVVADIYDTKDVLKLFAEAKFALCMRLHSVITAIITETPFLAVNYANKVEDFLEYADLKERLIDIKDIDSDELIKETKTASGKKALRSKIKAFTLKSEGQHEEAERLLKKTLQDQE